MPPFLFVLFKERRERGKGSGSGTYARKEKTMLTGITVTISLLIGAFIGIILAGVLAMGRDSDESASKSFAEWVNLKFYLVERHFGLRHS
jgi:hypothetical protein